VAPRNEQPENRRANNDGEHQPSDLDPGGNSREQEANDLGNAGWKRRLDSDGVEGRGVRCLKRRYRVLNSRDATELLAGHTTQRDGIELPPRLPGNLHRASILSTDRTIDSGLDLE